MSVVPKNGMRFISGVGKKKWQEVSGKPKGSPALCMGLQTQDTLQVGEDWIKNHVGLAAIPGVSLGS